MTLPQAFISQTEALLGADEAARLFTAITATPAAVSVRRNPAKISAEAFADHFAGQIAGRVPWSSHGIYLNERPKFTADPLLHAGCYYVQEAASMFLEQAAGILPATPRRVLDLCAAPGGKSTLWRTLLPEGALLVANEPIHRRAQILQENLTKWGHPDTVVTNAYPADFAPLTDFFDVVAADVPCSGEGMFRKDAEAVEQWTPDAPAVCAERAFNIISDIWPALRPGGHLVFSTCTYNRLENEDNVLRVCRELGAELLSLPVAPAWGVAGDATGRGLPVCRFFPHRVKGEGLFLAVLRKAGDAPLGGGTRREKKTRRAGGAKVNVQGGAKVAGRLTRDADFKYLRVEGNYLTACRESLADDVTRLCATVRTLSAGVLLGEDKGRKMVPQHALALTTSLSPEAFARVEIDRPTALAYLAREAVTLPPSAPRGYVVVCHEGHALGFANNLGARANNMYPAEWRIRHL